MTPESVPSAPPPPAPGAGEAPAGRDERQGADERRPSESPSASPPVGPSSPLAPRPSPLDALLAVSVCALAFLLASTPSRNSDLWLHLASGRSLLQGQARLGADPFASTTAGVFWVNH